MTQWLHLHNCPSKPFLEIRRKKKTTREEAGLTIILVVSWQIIQVGDALYRWKFGCRVSRKAPAQEREGPRPGPSAAWLCCRMRLGWLGSPAHPRDKDLAVSYRTPTCTSKKYRKETKKLPSITTLFNTKGYPILYTVVCGYLWSI